MNGFTVTCGTGIAKAFDAQARRKDTLEIPAAPQLNGTVKLLNEDFKPIN